METEKKTDKTGKKPARRQMLRLALILVVTFVFISLVSLWKHGNASWQDIGVMIAIIMIPVAFAMFPKIRRQIMNIIGEKGSIQRPSFRLILPVPFVLPFVFYLLTSGVEKSIPPALQWSVIATAPTIGGLVFAGASNRRIKRGTYFELISIVQKLIAATVLFILFTCLFFTVELTGGINTTLIDLSLIGWFRGGSFWLSVAFFYLGVYLFLIAIMDLVIALRRLIP